MLFEHKHCSTISDMKTKMATKWLKSREHLQHTGQGDDSCPEQDGAEWCRISSHYLNSRPFKTYELFMSGIFLLVLLNYS